MSTDKNPPTLKGEVANNFYGVAVLPVQDHESEDDDDNIVPASPVQGRRSIWGRGLMKSARSSIEQPRTYDDTSPPPALISASRSYYTSQWRTNTGINLVHIVDLNQPPPSADVLAAKTTAAQEVDATGERAHCYLASRQERVKAVLGIVGKDELKEGETRERVRIVCKSDQWTATAEIAQRYPADQPFSLTVRSIHQQAFVVLPRSFRGPVHFSTTSGSVILSAGVGAAYTHISKHYGFLGPDVESWSREPSKVEEEGLDECWASSDVARVHVRYDDEEPELDPLEEAAKKAGQTAKKVSSWFKNALKDLA